MSGCFSCSQENELEILLAKENELEILLAKLIILCSDLDDLHIETREIAYAIARLEEGVMWIKKHIED